MTFLVARNTGAASVSSGGWRQATHGVSAPDAVTARGAEAPPPRAARLDANSLAARIRWALDRPALTARAGEIGAALAREDGPARTAVAVEELAAGRAAG